MPDQLLSSAEVVVSQPPGLALTQLMMALSLRARAPVKPRLDGEGAHLRLARRRLGGEGELTVTADGSGSRIVLRGLPPPWPLARGWAERTLRRLLRGWGDGTVSAA